jgi:hypothetical protein
MHLKTTESAENQGGGGEFLDQLPGEEDIFKVSGNLRSGFC